MTESSKSAGGIPLMLILLVCGIVFTVLGKNNNNHGQEQAGIICLGVWGGIVGLAICCGCLASCTLCCGAKDESPV